MITKGALALAVQAVDHYAASIFTYDIMPFKASLSMETSGHSTSLLLEWLQTDGLTKAANADDQTTTVGIGSYDITPSSRTQFE